MYYRSLDRGGLTVAELVTLTALLLIAAATVAPKLLRAAIASDEAQAIADLRTVHRAEEAYAAANSGYYSDVTNLCRSGPECRGIGIPNYPLTSPEFLSADLGRVSPFAKDGYVHTWTADRAPNVRPVGADPSSVTGYCYTADPEFLGSVWRRAFSVDGSGRIFYDEYGATIACPIPYGTKLLEPERPALAVDFGRRGLWRYDGNDRWIRLARSNPDLLRASGDTLLATFRNRDGLYRLDEAGWTRIARRRASEVLTVGEGLVAQFRSEAGLWHWDGADWAQISTWEPEAMEVQGNKLFVDFGPEGLWLFWKPIGWTLLSDRDAQFLFADLLLFADLSDGQGMQEIYIDDLPRGDVWWWGSGGQSPENLLQVGTNLAWDFGSSRGTWWNGTQASPWDPYLLSHLDGDLLAAYMGRGLFRFESGTTLVELSPSEPTELAPADTYVGALFGDLKGVYRFDDSGSEQIARWRAQSVVAVGLTEASQSWRLRSVRWCPVPRNDRGPDSCRRIPRRRGAP